MAGLDEEILLLDLVLNGPDPRASWERPYDLNPAAEE